MEKLAVEKYINEQLEIYKRAFGNTDGFKKYITRKLNEKLGRFN